MAPAANSAGPAAGAPAVELAEGVLSPLHEAAVLYSADYYDATAEVLKEYLREPAGKNNIRAWLMMFDFYQLTHNRKEFDALSILYTVKWERSPPIWVENEEGDPRRKEKRERKDFFPIKPGADGALLPEIVSRAAAGDYAPLFAAASLVTADLAEQMNAALHYSVTCAEDASRVGPADVRTTLAKVREPQLVERVLAVCDVWPRGVQPADATTAVRSNVPALLLSGGLDPVTPPAYAAQVAQTLPASRHVVAPGFGHIVSPHGCGPRLIAAFVEHAGIDRLPSVCIERFEASSPPASWPNRLGPPA
jgi:hypothetical protein